VMKIPILPMTARSVMMTTEYQYPVDMQCTLLFSCSIMMIDLQLCQMLIILQTVWRNLVQDTIDVRILLLFTYHFTGPHRAFGLTH